MYILISFILIFQLFIQGLARMFFMHGDFPRDSFAGLKKVSKPKHHTHTIITESSPGTLSNRSQKRKEKRKIKSPVLSYNKWEPPTTNSHGRSESPMATRYQSPDRSPLHQVALETEVKDIRRALRAFMNRVHEKDAAARKLREWRVVALVLDRFFFFVYLVTIIVSLFTMFPDT